MGNIIEALDQQWLENSLGCEYELEDLIEIRNFVDRAITEFGNVEDKSLNHPVTGDLTSDDVDLFEAFKR